MSARRYDKCPSTSSRGALFQIGRHLCRSPRQTRRRASPDRLRQRSAALGAGPPMRFQRSRHPHQRVALAVFGLYPVLAPFKAKQQARQWRRATLSTSAM